MRRDSLGLARSCVKIANQPDFVAVGRIGLASLADSPDEVASAESLLWPWRLDGALQIGHRFLAYAEKPLVPAV